MFLSKSQIKRSLDVLANVHPFFGTVFLAFKYAGLPVGTAKQINFTATVEEILQRHYKPVPWHEGFYSPFDTSDKSNRWQKKRYASTTLQRIAADTFSEALIHPKGTGLWGWGEDYVEILQKHLNGTKIPVFHLAVWLFRNEVWSNDITPDDIVNEFVHTFDITPNEWIVLFDLSFSSIDQFVSVKPKDGKFELRIPTEEQWLQELPVTESDLLELIGYPKDTPPTSGAILQKLELKEVGPAENFLYEPSSRLNVITGDNSLGKTFIFDNIWWALTNEWIGYSARPREAAGSRARMSYRVQTSANTNARVQDVEARYEAKEQDWKLIGSKHIQAGLVIYSRFDGAFAIYDSTTQGRAQSSSLRLNRDEVWKGSGVVCNGLIRDWVSWQLGESRYKQEWNALSTCLKQLFPKEEAVAPGYPDRVNLHDDREIPVLIFPYGQVPVTLASAGVQRVLSLAYMLVWAWFRHRRNAEIVGQEPQRRLVLIIDEIEAHLHPRWQRAIVPSLISAIETLSSGLAPQIHLATHSAMVMASVEEVFDEKTDDLHHLKLEGRKVILEELPFIKRGRVDAWLTSEVFGLDMPRSIKGEEAIKRAKEIQLSDEPNSADISDINADLVRYLAQDDIFWPRWRFFAQKHGVNE